MPESFDPLDRPLVADTAGAFETALASQTERGVLPHDGPVFSAVFSPDGARVLTASADNTARLWDDRAPALDGGAMAGAGAARSPGSRVRLDAAGAAAPAVGG